MAIRLITALIIASFTSMPSLLADDPPKKADGSVDYQAFKELKAKSPPIYLFELKKGDFGKIGPLTKLKLKSVGEKGDILAEYQKPYVTSRNNPVPKPKPVIFYIEGWDAKDLATNEIFDVDGWVHHLGVKDVKGQRYHHLKIVK